jgi:chromate reductase
MKYIISGTDREKSNTLIVAQIIQKIYQDLGENIEIIDMKDVKQHLMQGPHYGQELPEQLQEYTDKVLKSDGLILVVPEYNGSMPGILKYFIDHLKFPESFEYRPVCFVGLGGMFGGLRPVEHLQGVFGYRNAFIYPQRVFLMNVWKSLQNGQLTDIKSLELLQVQAAGFQRFTSALRAAGLSARS